MIFILLDDLYKKISGGLYHQELFDQSKDKDGLVPREWLNEQANKLTPMEKMLLPPLERLPHHELYEEIDTEQEKEKILEKAQATSVGFMSFKKGESKYNDYKLWSLCIQKY